MLSYHDKFWCKRHFACFLEFIIFNLFILILLQKAHSLGQKPQTDMKAVFLQSEVHLGTFFFAFPEHLSQQCCCCTCSIEIITKTFFANIKLTSMHVVPSNAITLYKCVKKRLAKVFQHESIVTTPFRCCIIHKKYTYE